MAVRLPRVSKDVEESSFLLSLPLFERASAISLFSFSCVRRDSRRAELADFCCCERGVVIDNEGSEGVGYWDSGE